MENIIIFLACICFLFILGRIFIIPIKWICKLIFNFILGAVLIYAINLVGSIWGFHIGLNFFTAIIVGILGIPGAIFLIVISLLI
jgi:inhibitor of the pro-sigma K processing machinery